jgi:UDP-glucose 4-epimerase
MRAFAGCFDIDTVSLRYFNVFGPNQSPESQYAAVIPKFIGAALKDEQARIYGDPKISRDFTYVDNVVWANLLALGAKKDLDGEVINIACGKRQSLFDLLMVIEKIHGDDIDIFLDEARPGDVKHSQADIRKAKKLLGYKPKVGFEEGLKKTYKYYSGCLADGGK